MVSSLGRTAREQLTARDVLSLIAFLALVYGVTKDVETVLVIAFGFAFVEATSILRETPTVDSRWVGVGLGAFITVASLSRGSAGNSLRPPEQAVQYGSRR